MNPKKDSIQEYVHSSGMYGVLSASMLWTFDSEGTFVYQGDYSIIGCPMRKNECTMCHQL